MQLTSFYHVLLQLLNQTRNRKGELQQLIERADAEQDTQMSFKHALSLQLLGTICDKETSDDAGMRVIPIFVMMSFNENGQVFRWKIIHSLSRAVRKVKP